MFLVRSIIELVEGLWFTGGGRSWACGCLWRVVRTETLISVGFLGLSRGCSFVSH